MATDSSTNAPGYSPGIDRNAELVRFVEEYAASKLAANAAILTDDGQVAGAELVTRRNDYIVEIQDYEKLLDRPRRAHGSVTVDESASFSTYVNRYADADTVIYVDPRARRAVAVLNDNPHLTDDGRLAGWCDLRAVLEWKQTDEWLHWLNADQEMMDQEAFAELIEEGLADIAEPPGADLLEIAQSFKAAVGVNVRQARFLRDGRVSLAWEETIEAAAGRDGQMTIPDHITLAVAPFEGAERKLINARLRYRLRGRALELGYLLDRPEAFERAAIDVEIGRIGDALTHDVDIIIGRP